MLKLLKGFHIQAAHRMARVHKPKRGPNKEWTYPKRKDVLKECGLETIKTFILRRRVAIAEYVATIPIFTACTEAERRKGSPPRQWWWEQPTSLDNEDADGNQ